MKQNIFFRVIVAIAMMLIGWLPSLAHDFESGGIYYNITSSAKHTVEVTSSNSKYSGDIVIPETISYGGVEYSVTSIGSWAFDGCENLTSIEIPNSVTSIGEKAFYDCEGLTSIEIPNSVTSIGNQAFRDCSGLTSIEIPNSVTSIGNEAFLGSGLTSVVWNAIKCGDFAYNKGKYGPFYDSRGKITSFTFGDSVEHIPAYLCYYMSKLTSIEIPNSVTSIGKSAFFYCTRLTSIEIPNSVTSIGKEAFDGCTGLTSIEIPNSVTSIADYAFRYCSGLTSIEIPNSVTSIGNYAFEYCSGLTSIEIPNSVTSIGYQAFSDCTGLTSVVWNVVNCSDFSNSLNAPFYNSHVKITSFTFGDSVEHIPAFLCYEMSKLTSIEIPNSVTSIGKEAFDGCTGLTSVVWNAVNYSDFSNSSNTPFYNSRANITSFTFGDSVEHIPAYLCYDMSKLTSIKIPNSVTSIGEYAFEDCDRLTSIEIPNSVTSIGNQAFRDCSGLTSVVWNVVNYSDFSNSSNTPFYACLNITSFRFGDSVEYIPGYLCCKMSKLTSIEIPNSVTSIGEGAFRYCDSLTSVTIPDSVTSIGFGVFDGCTSLTSVTIGNSVTSIGNSAFSGCTGLTSIEIPNSVTSIADYTFSGCKGLTSVTIGNSVTSIGEGAFRYCDSLTSVTIGNSVTSIGNEAFKGSGLTSIEIPNSVTSIAYKAFEGCSGLTSVTIGNSVTSIGDYAFRDCSGLTSVVWNVVNCSDFSNSLNAPFYNSRANITSFTFGDSVEHIPAYLCYEMSKLTSIEIPNSVTSIGKEAFRNCHGLTSVTIGNSVTEIGNSAFYNCSGLTSVVWNAIKCGDFAIDYRPFQSYASPNITSFTFGDSVEHIPAYLCYGLSKLTSIEIPNSVTSIAYRAFEGCSGLTSVTIGNSVTSIAESTFTSCSGLTNVYINDLKAYCNIEFGNIHANPVYYANNLYLNGELIEDLVIPEGVSKISDALFYRLDHIKSVTIPNSVTSIAYRAFEGCSGLTSVVWNVVNYSDFSNSSNTPFYNSRANITSFTFGDSVEHIPAYLCYGLSKLTSIEIPNSVTSIGQSAFLGCTGLTSVTIGNSVTSIGKEAFDGCTGLTTVTIGNSVTSIGKEAFDGCTGLTSVVWNVVNYSDFSDYSYTPFYNFRANITSFTFGDSVEHIPAYLCYEMSKLTSIEIPNSVTSIGESAFEGCTGLTSVTIGNSVTSIREYTFSSCHGLTSVTIGNSVTSIGSDAFSFCWGLTSVVWNAVNCSDFSYTPFYDSRTNITSFTFGDSVEHIPACLCYGLSKLTSIEIPNSVTSIGSFAFEYCSGLTSVTIGNSVTSIGDYAFEDCLRLTSVVWNAVNCSDFSNSSNTPFYNSYANITSFTFGDSVEHIPAYLCCKMSKLTSIEIPNSVTSIGNQAFSDCTGLTSVVWNAVNCSDFSNSSNTTFYNSYANITSFTFGDSVEHIPAYLCCKMSKLTSIEIPNSVTSIGEGAFYNCSGLTSIEIPNSVTSIGGGAFLGCRGLTSIEIPNSVTSIGNYAFEYCSGLTSIEIPNSVTSIGYQAFSDCTGLTSVVWNVVNCSDFSNSLNAPFYNSHVKITSFTFGDSVEHIPAFLCYEMSKLTSIEIPNSVTSIGKEAFDGCTGLTSVVWNAVNYSDFSNSSNTPFYNSRANITSFTFGDSIEHIPAYLCYGMSRLTSVIIGNSVTSIGKDAFNGCKGFTEIKSLAQIPPAINSSTFNYVDKSIPVYVPAGCKSAYQSAEYWKEFAYIIEFEEVVLAESITLEQTEISLNITETAELIATILPKFTANKTIVWSSSDESIAVVDANGLVTAIAVGEAIITATTTDGSDLSATCKVTVVPTLAESIALDQTEISLEATETATLVATILPETTSNKGVEWSSSNESVAVVDANGLVTAIAVGEAIITATITDGSDLSATCKVTVVPTLAESISFDKTEISLEATETTTLVATVLPETTSDKGVEWSSSNESVAVVDANGLVTAIAVGEAIITATTVDGSNLSATCKITVIPTLAETITLDKTEISLEATETATLIVTMLPELTTDKSVEWSSSNEAVATVDANGVVTAIAVGEATITATTVDDSNLSASCKVTVVPTLAVSIELNQTEASVEEKLDLQLIATILPEHTTNKEVAWSSSDKWVASVDNYGLVTMYSAGEVIITATTTDGTNLSATCRINVYSGIDGVNGDDVIVATVGDNIVVKNAKLGSNVRVYAADGSIITSEIATDGDVVVEAPVKGIYVVAIDGKSFKVMVK